MPFDFISEQFLRSFLDKFLAGIAFAAFGYLLARGRDFRRQRVFRRIFGRNMRSAEDIVVSVPLWLAVDAKREAHRFRKQPHNGPALLRYGPDQMYNRQDMYAAAHVLNVLGNHLKHEVSYSNDTEQPEWGQKTLILIGSPTANLHAQFYLDEHRQKWRQQNFPVFEMIPETEDTGAIAYIRDPVTGKDYRSDKHTDYGLVLRLGNATASDPDRFVFLIAGIHEWSTREAGRLFNVHWKTLGKERRWLRWLLPWKRHEPPKPTGFIFKMDYKQPGTGRDLKYI